MKSYDNLHRWSCQRKTRLNIASPRHLLHYLTRLSLAASGADIKMRECPVWGEDTGALYFYAAQELRWWEEGFPHFFSDVQIISTDAQKL